MTAMPNPLLSDLLVIDLSTLIAGPGCARYFADFGARVIKVERPGAGDPARRIGDRDHDDVALLFKLLNRGKVSVRLDLKSDSGREDVLRLVERADVVVENLRPGTLERLGLGPDVLTQRNPRLVLTRISAFGQDGPYAKRPGFATIAEAMSGFAHLNGEVDGPPMLPPIALTDEVTALVAFGQSLVGLHTGRGQVIDVNLLESMMSLMGPAVLSAAAFGVDQERFGSGLPYSVPRGVFKTLDAKYVAVSGTSDGVAKRILDVVGLGEEASVATADGRIAHRERVHQAVAHWIGNRPQSEVIKILDAADAAVAPIMSPVELVRNEHVVARGALEEVGGLPMPGRVARFDAGMPPLRGPQVDADSVTAALELLYPNESRSS